MGDECPQSLLISCLVLDQDLGVVSLPMKWDIAWPCRAVVIIEESIGQTPASLWALRTVPLTLILNLMTCWFVDLASYVSLLHAHQGSAHLCAYCLLSVYLYNCNWIKFHTDNISIGSWLLIHSVSLWHI